MSEEWVSKGEFNLLRDMVQANATHIGMIDSAGTRGSGILQVSLTELIKDVSELKADMNARFTDHDRLHEREKSERLSSRRWFIGTTVALLTAMGGLYPFLYTLIVSRAGG